MIGSAYCDAMFVNNSLIMCSLNDHVAGKFNMTVNIKDQGYSNRDKLFTYKLNVVKVDRNEGKLNICGDKTS